MGNFFLKNYEGKGNFLHEFDFHPQKPLLLGLYDTFLVPFTDGYSQTHSVGDWLGEKCQNFVNKNTEEKN